MRTALFIVCLLIPSFALAAAETSASEIRIRPSRKVEVTCIQGANTIKISGSSDELKLLRVGQSTASYEVYRDDFIVASCDSVIVETP